MKLSCAVATVLVALALPAVAVGDVLARPLQVTSGLNPDAFPKPFVLDCYAASGFEGRSVAITNTTAFTMKKGWTVHWSMKPYHGKQKLTADLHHNGQIRLLAPGGAGGPCTGWVNNGGLFGPGVP